MIARRIPMVLLFLVSLSACHVGDKHQQKESNVIRVATFNVSMEADNYPMPSGSLAKKRGLEHALASGTFQQINTIAEIIQHVRPDIILLNEFDYISLPSRGIELFKKRYLEVGQNRMAPITYPYVYLKPVNTGVPTNLPNGSRLPHYGFGKYPGQYGMVLLSKFPIQCSKARTFKNFLWKDMPNNLMPLNDDGSSWYGEKATNIMRLSSKSHWDIPLDVRGRVIHILASHPTPPVFDGPENRNGRRNHDEIRFWKDYLAQAGSEYMYDDRGIKGGFKGDSFVILGDMNASPVEGDAFPGAITQLLEQSRVLSYQAPTSLGGQENKPNSPHALTHTAEWGLRADYVLPSANFTISDSGVFWPSTYQNAAQLMSNRNTSSDHRLVWVDIELPPP